MRGDSQAGSARLTAPAVVPRWSEWISLGRRGHHRSRQEQLEVMARLASQERSAGRVGEYEPRLPREWAPR